MPTPTTLRTAEVRIPLPATMLLAVSGHRLTKPSSCSQEIEDLYQAIRKLRRSLNESGKDKKGKGKEKEKD